MHLHVVDFKKKKRAEESTKESQKAAEKSYRDCAWKDLCEDPTKLKSSEYQSQTNTPNTKDLRSI